MNKNNSGQALLLILLVMAAIITVGASIVSRSVTDVSISSREVESQRAFSAAEAGVEKALLNPVPILSQNLDSSGTSFNASVSNFAELTTSFVYPSEILNGDVAPIWFVSHDSNNNDSLSCNNLPCFTGSSLHVCWGKPGTNSNQADTPAIEMSLFYSQTPGNSTTTKVVRAAVDPNASRRVSNSFSSPDGGNCTIGGQSFEFQERFNFSVLGVPPSVFTTANGLQFARIKLLYNSVSQPIAFEVTGGRLPSQGRQIDSSGASGQATRKVQVFTVFPDIPPVFDSAIFTPGSITK